MMALRSYLMFGIMTLMCGYPGGNNGDSYKESQGCEHSSQNANGKGLNCQTTANNPSVDNQFTATCHQKPDLNMCFNTKNIVVMNDTYSGLILQHYDNCPTNGNCNRMKDTCIIAVKESISFGNSSVNLSIGEDKIIWIYFVPEKKQFDIVNLTILNGINCVKNFNSKDGIQLNGGCTSISVNLSQECSSNPAYDGNKCKDHPEDTFVFGTLVPTYRTCVKCSPRPDFTASQISSKGGVVNALAAAEVMKNLSSLIDQMGNKTTATVDMGEVKGILKVITKEEAQNNVTFSLATDGSFGTAASSASRSFLIPNEAINQAQQTMDKVYVGVFRFPDMTKDEKNSTILNNEVFAIEMGTSISSLSSPINIEYRKISKGNSSLVCHSWNGAGAKPTWTADGCHTETVNDTVTCKCNHLTFFAMLMVRTENISASDMQSLTYITNVGCGLSMLFLGVALFMHVLFRRSKATKATKILMNLFFSMFMLNLTFLTNSWLTQTGNSSLCKMIAGTMHYFMLSTFTWFALQALHLYLQLVKVFNIDFPHYIRKILIVGWGVPLLAPIAIFIADRYGPLTTSVDGGNPVCTCWITENVIHYIVNIGYYAVVFLFTLAIFILVVLRIVHLKKGTAGVATQRTTKKDAFTVMGLCCLLGLTWGFAFFSYGPMAVPSYYIFTILNSFQGFFLFLYYYNTSTVSEDRNNSKLSRVSSLSKSTYSSQSTVHKSEG